MKKCLLQVTLLLAALTIQAQGTYQAISGYGSSVVGAQGGTSGFVFQPTIDLTLTALGCLDIVAGDQSPILIGLFSDSGEELASDTVTSSSPVDGLARFGGAAFSIKLLAGQTYRIGAFSATGAINLNPIGFPGLGGSFALGPGIDANSIKAANSENESSLTFPSTLGPAGSMFLAPTFLYSGPVPEPSSLALLGLGGLALLTQSRRRAR